MITVPTYWAPCEELDPTIVKRIWCGNLMQGLTVEVVTDLVTEPVSLALAKQWLRVDGSEEDALITMIITSSRQQLEQYCGRSFGEKTLKATAASYVDRLALPYAPIASIETVKKDGQLSLDFKQGNLGLVYIGSGNNLEVTYKTQADIPGLFKTALLSQITFNYIHRGDESFGSISEEAAGMLAGYVQYNLF